MSREYAASLAGWYFLPGLATNWGQTLYYSITIRAGDPHPQPGTPVFNRHRRNIFTLVIVGYLLFTVYQTDWSLRQDGDFYSDLALPHDGDEKTLQRLLRRALALAHPDKYASSQQEQATIAFNRVKEAYDTLTDPARRFAYDRFGRDMLAWTNCKSVRDYVVQGTQNSFVALLTALIVMLIAQAFGQMQHGTYWRYLTLASLLVFELHTMTRPTYPRILTRVLNPLLASLPGVTHPPYLPFQFTKLARQTSFSLFIAVNQLAPRWSPPTDAAQEEAAQNQLLAQIKRVVAAATLDSQRLLALEHAPFAGNARSESTMRERLVEWLVQNEVRNDPAVSAAMKKVVERRNAEVDGGSRNGDR